LPANFATNSRVQNELTNNNNNVNGDIVTGENTVLPLVSARMI